MRAALRLPDRSQPAPDALLKGQGGARRRPLPQAQLPGWARSDRAARRSQPQAAHLDRRDGGAAPPRHDQGQAAGALPRDRTSGDVAAAGRPLRSGELGGYPPKVGGAGLPGLPRHLRARLLLRALSADRPAGVGAGWRADGGALHGGPRAGSDAQPRGSRGTTDQSPAPAAGKGAGAGDQPGHLPAAGPGDGATDGRVGGTAAGAPPRGPTAQRRTRLGAGKGSGRSAPGARLCPRVGLRERGLPDHQADSGRGPRCRTALVGVTGKPHAIPPEHRVATVAPFAFVRSASEFANSLAEATR